LCEFEDQQYGLQRERLVALFDHRLNRSDITLQQARDVMWTLTSREAQHGPIHAH
jgi:hypothetical protein